MTTKKKAHPIKKLNRKDQHWYLLEDDQYTKKEAADPKTLNVISLYEKDETPIIDTKYPDFYKGSVDPNGKIMGARITVLPNGKKLARGGFSLFAKNLEFSDEKDHWAVKYDNPSGSTTYLYDEEHLEHEHAEKSARVDRFIKFYPKIYKQLKEDLDQKFDIEKLALMVLMRSYLRVGNYEYYLSHQHQGLTTLMKKNMKVEDGHLHLKFIGKDGVPQDFKIHIEEPYLSWIEDLLKNLNDDDFVFAIEEKPMHPDHFTKILHHYTGDHFYPHIIRSYYADNTSGHYLEKNEEATKEEVENLYTKIARTLGHKKFNKKKNKWEVDYHVTIKNYIRPNYVQQLNALYEKK